MDMQIEGFGDTNIDNSTGGGIVKERTLKTGHNVFRLIGAIKSMAPTGTWAVYRGKHWGYEGVSRKDRTKTVSRPFRCLQERDFDSGALRSNDAECERIQVVKDKLEALVATLKTEGKSKEQIKEDKGVILLNGWLRSHNCDRKWYINAMDTNGDFFLLKLSNTTYKKLKLFLKDLRDKRKINAFSLTEGVWLDIVRVGENTDADDTPTLVMEIVDQATGTERPKRAPMTEAQAREALAKCADLADVVPALTADQIKLMVNTEGDPEAVDRIWALGARVEKQAPTNLSPEQSKALEEFKAPAATPTPAAAPSAEEELRKKIAELQAQLDGGKLSATPAATVAPVTQPTVTEQPKAPTTTPPVKPAMDFEALKNMPHEDFLAQFKLGQKS